jgi:hypothetical protein
VTDISHKANYDFSSRGKIELEIDPSSTICDSEINRMYLVASLSLKFVSEPWYERQNALEIMLYASILLCAVLSQILTLKAIFKSVALYQNAKRRLKSSAPSVRWRDLPLDKKMKFFNIWFFV